MTLQNTLLTLFLKKHSQSIKKIKEASIYVLLTLFFIIDESFVSTPQKPIPGMENIDLITNLLNKKRIALVVNQTSILTHNDHSVHLVDTLLKRGITIVRIFSPEHGFRGIVDAGTPVNNSCDIKTNIPIISLFGNQLKPSKEQLQDVDIVIYDIQDVGVRFYTYISTLHYVMESCASYGKPLIVLDRPNPNDHIDGPIMKDGFQSFIGIDPLPILYGMTVGELARMINKEGWLRSKPDSCMLTIIPVRNWRHGEPYILPIKASPNLPNEQSIRLYASICIMGPTKCSVGRGTPFPFQVIGFPNKSYGNFCFTPKSISGSAIHPPYENKKCYGKDLRKYPFKGGLTLRFLFDFYKKSNKSTTFIKDTTWFDHLIGNDNLRYQIAAGLNEKQIRKSWEIELNNFRKLRHKYLLYSDYSK